jgi:hypothetical protein
LTFLHSTCQSIQMCLTWPVTRAAESWKKVETPRRAKGEFRMRERKQRQDLGDLENIFRSSLWLEGLEPKPNGRHEDSGKQGRRQLGCAQKYIPFLFLFLLSHYCTGGILWHLQQCLQYILVKFTLSIILLYPPSHS